METCGPTPTAQCIAPILSSSCKETDHKVCDNCCLNKFIISMHNSGHGHQFTSHRAICRMKLDFQAVLSQITDPQKFGIIQYITGQLEMIICDSHISTMKMPLFRQPPNFGQWINTQPLQNFAADTMHASPGTWLSYQ